MSKNGKKHHSLRIGITGGIGSGKTTVCRIFESLGIPVYYADDRAKAIMVEDSKVVAEIVRLLGKDAYLPDGTLNRPYIAKIVFSEPERLARLNAIVHPAVFRDGDNWHHRQKNAPYTIKEAALLVESGGYKKLDKLIVVTAPEALRIERVVKRDGVEEEAVRARMRQQLPEEEKVKLADFVIRNDGSESLIRQVWDIHQKLIAAKQNATHSGPE